MNGKMIKKQPPTAREIKTDGAPEFL